MAVQVPVLRCSLVWELYNSSGQLIKRENLKLVDVGLSRNEFKEIVLEIGIIGKEIRTRKIALKYETLNVFRKFVKEGKVTLSFSDTHTKLLLSNAPPNELVIFTKTLAAKLAGSKNAPKVPTRTKLLSEMGNSTEGISPVTARDVTNMKHAEAGGKGLLKMRGYTPNVNSPLTTGRTLKRKRITDEKENSLCASPVLSGAAGTLNLEGPTPKRKANILARSTPTRQSGLIARRPLRAEPVAIMTQEQRYVLDCVKSGKNVFFTGGAGTGKSFLIQKIIGVLPPDHTFVTASTGVAAFQIGGTTLHSFAGIGSGTAPISTCVELAKRKTVTAQWRKCKHLIIDEVSMVDGNFFKKLEYVARTVRGNDKPFGGIQLILTGDFLQLPPVSKDDNRRFAFETSAWQRCVQMNIELTEVKRQSDQALVDILNRLRMGKCTEADAEVLKGTKGNVARDGIVPTKLCTHTEDVNMINKRELERCEGEEKKFFAVDSDPGLSKFIENSTPVEGVVRLRVGAQVMLLKNLQVSTGLVNGARGRVESFTPEGNPVVVFLGGNKQEIKYDKWMVKSGVGVTLTRTQIPLRLAWAFSIHKSQGMTLDCVEVSLSRVFECGQAYVALSRAKNLHSLRILDFKPGCVRADGKVIKFYKQLTLAKPAFQQKIDNMFA
eukprot:GFUD01022082.1.p1 GENE.GFUD01022082.1~~GFUD01022082.1.p1  ORF type:complete len:663 (-),score=151.50 GFUD01022082.1:268-2256(-)